ncbi:hypothetical protein [Gorillibacterium sp. sgz500922]|uniref:hypothetical protein n=1 Tax=Gorillibacterium sp. sgz500922 TaxID=3446694 RepID=UPI003F67B960
MIKSLAATDALMNQSRIQYSAGETQWIAYSNTISTPLVGPVITLVKSTSVTMVTPGVPVTFSVVVRNTGNRAAQVVLFDSPEEGTEFIANSLHRDGIPVPGADLATGLSLGLLGPGQATQITFQLVVPVPLPSGTLENQALARYVFEAGGGRVVTGSARSNLIAIPIDPISKPDIRVALNVNQTGTTVGAILQYTAVVVNLGNLSADVVLLVRIPDGTVFVPNSIRINGVLQSGGYPAGGIALGTLLPGQQVTVTYEVTVLSLNAVSPGQSLQNQAEAVYTYRASDGSIVTSTSPESNPVSTTVYAPVIVPQVSVSPSVVEPEDVIHYVLVLTNSGNLAAEVTIGRFLPRDTRLVPGSIRINGVPAPDPGGDGLLRLGSIAPGQSIEITFDVMISPFIMTTILGGDYVASYSYELNGVLYRGEARSNAYTIVVETHDE